MRQPSVLYKRHRFRGKIISHAVWLYFRFLLSYRDVEELLAERGIAVTYEAIRRWCRKFGQAFADAVRRRPRPGDKWHPVPSPGGTWPAYRSSPPPATDPPPVRLSRRSRSTLGRAGCRWPRPRERT